VSLLVNAGGSAVLGLHLGERKIDSANHAIGLEAPVYGRIRKTALDELGAEPLALRRRHRRPLPLSPSENDAARPQRPRQVHLAKFSLSVCVPY
jgi:hypothetical protein